MRIWSIFDPIKLTTPGPTVTVPDPPWCPCGKHTFTTDLYTEHREFLRHRGFDGPEFALSATRATDAAPEFQLRPRRPELTVYGPDLSEP